MRFYADLVATRDLHDVAAELSALARIPARGAIERARDGLILAGMVEQACEDRAEGDSPSMSSATRSRLDECVAYTQWWADWLAVETSAMGQAAPASAQPPRGPGSGLHETSLPLVVPEGYLFYALYPEVYVELGRLLAPTASQSPLWVIGVRSIGTSLSAAVGAGLRQQGCAVARCTVRPGGDPFARVVTANSALSAAWRAAALRGAYFVVVDEGPGLSGSSLASTVQALERCGVSADHTIIVCANPPGRLPHCTDAVRNVWARTRWLAAQDTMDTYIRDRLPSLLARSLNIAVTLQQDLSWGSWVGVCGTEAGSTLPSLRHLERRKLLLQAGEHMLCAKFMGFGWNGLRKADLAHMLSGAQLVPAYRGFAQGMLLQDWIADRGPVRWSDADIDQAIDGAARYYATLRRQCVAGTATNLDVLTEIVHEIAVAWLGAVDLSCLHLLRAQAAAAAPLALHGDQRPERVEWVRGRSGWLKCDAADHFLDHTWAREQDICFDLAGFIAGWSLTPARQERLLAQYQELSGDVGAGMRLGFYRCVYAAHRLAALDTAFHALQGAGGEALDAARQAAGTLLRAALVADDACVS